MRIVVGIVAASLVSVLIRGFLAPNLSIPESIAGVSRNHDATAMDFEQKIADEADRKHVTMKGAMYGPGTPGSFAVIAGAHSADGPETTFQDFAQGLSDGSGAQVSVDLGAMKTEQADGTTYICAPVNGSAPGGLCMWADGGSTGFVETFDRGASAARTLIAQVRSAVLS